MKRIYQFYNLPSNVEDFFFFLFNMKVGFQTSNILAKEICFNYLIYAQINILI